MVDGPTVNTKGYAGKGAAQTASATLLPDGSGRRKGESGRRELLAQTYSGEMRHGRQWVLILWLLLAATPLGAGERRLFLASQTEEQPRIMMVPRVGPGQVCDQTIGRDEVDVDGAGNYAGVAPGDTVCIASGSRPALRLRNFQGTADEPITFVNAGGVVVISGAAEDYAGVSLFNSEHIRLTGAGLSGRCGAAYLPDEQRCGIVIRDAARGVTGTERTRHVEIDHVAVHSTRLMGFFVRSSHENGTSRDTWTQYGTFLHHNYVRDTGTEGIYVGSSHYSLGLDPVLIGVEISHNLIVASGWDGLQVGSAVADCLIHHNRILNASLANRRWQESGLMNNRGSTCDIYNNYIADSMSEGIYVQGNGGNHLYNNVIVRPGRLQEEDGDGIVITSGSNREQSIFVWNNTIVEPSRYGILFRNDVGENNQIQNNLIVEPGASSSDDPVFIQTGGRSNVDVSNNLYLQKIAEARFVNAGRDDFSLLPDSPAIDAGRNLAGVDRDHEDVPRPQGGCIDIGAFEHRPDNGVKRSGSTVIDHEDELISTPTAILRKLLTMGRLLFQRQFSAD